MVGWPIRTPLLKGDWKIETQRNVIHDDGDGHMRVHVGYTENSKKTDQRTMR
jgi:hypothetical protein